MVKYEFSEEENKKFEVLSNFMVMASLLFLINAILAGIHVIAFEGGVFFVVYSVSMIILAVTFYIPTDNFKRIVTTAGQDIKELLEGFTEISAGWTILILILLVHKLSAIIQVIISLL